MLVDGDVEVGDYEKITPLALFEFGGLEPSAGAQHVTVSPLAPVGWKRQNVDDEDPRMAVSTSGPANGMFDGDDQAMHLRFTITPTDGAALDAESLGFWGNSGAFADTTLTLTYQVADAAPVEVGTKELRNLSCPGVRGEYYSFPLGGLTGAGAPITFTLTASRNGERVLLKIDDLRVDGFVRR